MVNYFKNKSFIIIFTLGSNKNIKTYSNTYINRLSFIKVLNTLLVLRIKNLFNLLKAKNFNIFFFDYLKTFFLGYKNSFKNSLKNNFKLFLYSLYNINVILHKFIKNLDNIDSVSTINNLVKSNIYYTYNFNSNFSNSFYYNFLYKDSFTSINCSLINKFFNFSYFKSNKKKRFKQKESEKLSILRNNLDSVKQNPFRLKFYYKYFEYKRLHPYWNKEAFLKKKFKYFNPKDNNNIFLLHFFYKFRKFRKFSKKYNLFKKLYFINFWLQAPIKKFQFCSYKIKNKKTKKTNYKLNKFYFDSILLQNKKLFNSLYFKYKRYFFRKKIKYCSLLFKSYKLFYLSLNKRTKKNQVKFLNSYHNFKNFQFKANINLLSQNKSTFLTSNLFKKKYFLNFQLLRFNFNRSTKKFLFNSLKKNKFFRIKLKYIKWLNQQKIFKNWKFNKYLSYRRVSFKIFKNHRNMFNSFNFKTKTISTSFQNAIYDAKFWIYYWSKNNSYFQNIHKKKKIHLILKNFKKASDNYFKIFSFYKSNKLLDLKYTYLNLFKNFRLNTGVFKNKSKNNFILQKLSKNSFKKSWLLVYKQFKKTKKYKGFYNLVPIYNVFFIKKVLSLYKFFFTSKISFFYSTLFFSSFNRSLFDKKFSSFLHFKSNTYNNLVMNPIKSNVLNRICNIRWIDKHYSFKKKGERQLLYLLKNYQNTQSLLLSKKNVKSHLYSSTDFIKQHKKLHLFSIQKLIKKIRISLNILSNSNFKYDLVYNQDLKYNYFKKINFLNFLKSYNTATIRSLYFNKKKFSFIIKSIFLMGPPLKKKKINKLRKNLLKNKSFFTFIKNKNFKLDILNNLYIHKFKKIDIVSNNFKINFLLKRDYFFFLKLFKFFSLYKQLDLSVYNKGFGKLLNHFNINNENIFSKFNFYIYNFLNFSLEHRLFYNRSTYLTSIIKNVNINNFLFSNNILSSALEEEDVTIYENNSYNFNYPYDILNINNSINSKIIYSKNFLIKYMSLLNVNNLFNLKINKYTKKSYPSNFKILYINYYINNDVYSNYYININVSLKKFYYNTIDNYNRIMNISLKVEEIPPNIVIDNYHNIFFL